MRRRPPGPAPGAAGGMTVEVQRSPMPSFLSAYLQYAGLSVAPRIFHLWSGLSAMAAAVADRVWIDSHSSQLPPNLYAFLIGPSGIGKGVAIHTAMRLLDAAGVTRLYNGMLTAQHLCDLLGSRATKHLAPKVLLVTEELSLSIGDKVLADRLLRLATKLYECTPYDFVEGTRTHGTVTFRGHVINWLAGTTQEWLRDSVPRSAIEGGFFARVNAIVCPDLLRRITRPALDLTVFDALVQRLQEYTMLAGPMVMDAQADAVYWDWYEQRPLPPEPILEPVWARVPIHVLKLAMLLSLSDSLSMVIEERHVTQARLLAEESLRHLPALIEFVALTPETDGMRLVREAIRRAGALHHTPLMRKMIAHGLSGDDVRRHVDTLVQGGLVERTPGTRQEYTWLGKVRLEDVPDDDGGSQG